MSQYRPELPDPKRPGETFHQLLAGVIEWEKKALLEHLMQIADEGDSLILEIVAIEKAHKLIKHFEGYGCYQTASPFPLLDG